jgi:adenosylcobinamide-GDP ribazoletransferase
MKRQLSLFLVAVQFLTRLPVPPGGDFQTEWLRQSARYFPLVGALIGWIAVAVWRVSALCFPPVVAVGMMMGATLLLTGAFHEDGFADVCDGFGGGTTRDAVLSIMKDSRVGAFGAIGIGMMLALKWSTLASLPSAAIPVTVIGAHLASRWCATGLIWRLQYVRADADAKSKPFDGSMGTGDWLLSGAVGALALLPAIVLIDARPDISWARTLPAALACAVAGAVLAGAYFKFRIGGYTGDCLGAAQQIAELSFSMAVLGTLAAAR